LNCLKRLKSN